MQKYNWEIISWEDALKRKYEEKENLDQTPIDKDYAKIIFCPAYRELNDKTQVFITGKDKRWCSRNRASHSQEVAYTADRLANYFNLEANLARNLALMHDFGHGPGGHEYEKQAEKFMGIKYNHDAQAIRVVEKIFHLNLTMLTLDDILARANREIDDKYMKEGKLHGKSSLEGQCTEIADKLSFIPSDIEDIIFNDLVKINDLKDEKTLQIIITECEKELSAYDFKNSFILMNLFKKKLYNKIRSDIYENCKEIRDEIIKIKEKTPKCFIVSKDQIICCSEKMNTIYENLKNWMYKYIYHGKMKQRDEKIKITLNIIFNLLLEKNDLINIINIYNIPRFEGEDIKKHIVDVVMTCNENRLRNFFLEYILI